MGRRFQARRGNGQFIRNTLENNFGLHADTCPSCNRYITYGVNEPPPDECPHCGTVIVREKCAHGRCTEPFMDPFVFRRGGYAECGEPAVASSVKHQWGLCADHVPKEDEDR